MRDFSDALADDSRELGEELLLYTVDRLTDEMEIPYQFDWVVGVTLRKQNHGATVKDLAYESFNEFTEKIAKGLGYEYELCPTWYEDYKSDEFTIFQAFSVLRAKRLSNEELFITSGCNTSAIFLTTRRRCSPIVLNSISQIP